MKNYKKITLHCVGHKFFRGGIVCFEHQSVVKIRKSLVFKCNARAGSQGLINSCKVLSSLSEVLQTNSDRLSLFKLIIPVRISGVLSKNKLKPTS
jgi:hypothetical protein